ncbi:MAG: hypothetical protein IJ299_00290 [Oscillospiraceae bacterium]|nr:hypothetical protein [Oscillospiraceae bacterium]
MPQLINESWLDVLKGAIIRYGNTGLLVVVFFAAFALGAFLMWLYLTKIKYAKLEFEATKLKDEKKVALSKLEEADRNIKELERINKQIKEECTDINSYRHAVKATEKDVDDIALKDFMRIE